MKTISKSFLILAAMIFSACEDIPAPYIIPSSGASESAGTSSSSRETPYTIAQAKSNQSGAYGWVRAYIVGSIPQSSGTSYIDNAEFGTANAQASNIIIAADPAETNHANCMAIQLPTGDVRSALNLKDKPENLGKEVLLYGTLEKYYGAAGMKNISYTEFEGKTYGTDPDTEPEPGTELEGATGDGTESNPFNVIAAINKCIATGSTATTEEYYVSGIVSQLHTQYANNFYLSDDGTSTNQMMFYNGQGINGATINSGDIKVGDKVVVKGKLQNYNGTYELTKGCTIISLNGSTGSGSTGGSTGGGTAEPGTNKIIDLSTFGLANETEATTLIADDVTLTFSVESGSTKPKYYTATKGIRMYANNSLTITAGKNISKVILSCDSSGSTNYVGNKTMTVDPGTISIDGTQVNVNDINASSVKIANTHSSTSGGTQLRIKTITIEYAQ